MSKQFIQPMEDRLLVEIMPVDDSKSPGGIVIPETARQTQRKPVFKSRVVQVGNGEKIVKSKISPGDIVFITPFSGAPADPMNDNLLFINYGEVLGVLRDQT